MNLKKLIDITSQFYENFIKIAKTSKARYFLYFFSFLESIVIPLPTDPLLIACVLANTKKWIKICFFTTISSVLGGILGWYLGSLAGSHLNDLISLIPSFIKSDNLIAKFNLVSQKFNQVGVLLILIGAFTPLPFKIISILSGFFSFEIISFIFLAFIGRSSRFFIIGCMTKYRKNYKIFLSLLSLLLFLIFFAYVMLNFDWKYFE